VTFFVRNLSVANQIRDILRSKCRYDAARILQNLRLTGGGTWHLAILHRCLQGAQQIETHLHDLNQRLINGTSNTLQKKKLQCKSDSGLEKTLKVLFPLGFNVPDEMVGVLGSVLPEEVLSGQLDVHELPRTLDQPGTLPEGYVKYRFHETYTGII
jgi:hypothetical protein